MPETQFTIMNENYENLTFVRYSVDDPEFMMVYFRAPSSVRSLFVGESLGVCDFEFHNGRSHRVHVDFCRALWDALVKTAGWKRVIVP